jgi:ankyrin repeat protein
MGLIDGVRQRITQGIDINARHPDGTHPTPLFTAVLYTGLDAARYLPIVHLLLDKGAEVDRTDGQGVTPLMKAVSAMDVPVSVVQLLLKRGADPNVQDPAKRTALMKAVSAGNTPAVKELLRHHCRLDLRNYRGQTALKVAYIRAAPTEIIRMLKAYGAK